MEGVGGAEEMGASGIVQVVNVQEGGIRQWNIWN